MYCYYDNNQKYNNYFICYPYLHALQIVNSKWKSLLLNILIYQINCIGFRTCDLHDFSKHQLYF